MDIITVYGHNYLDCTERESAAEVDSEEKDRPRTLGKDLKWS